MSIRTLRFYEDRGLLHPRREGTSRRYGDRDRLHLKMILKGKSLGFTLSENHGILTGRGDDLSKMDLEMGLLPEQITTQIDYLERQRGQIDEAITTLRKAYGRLLNHVIETPADHDLAQGLRAAAQSRHRDAGPADRSDQ